MADLICHLVWMENYRGEDDLEPGGFRYVQETGDAHESRNFEADPATNLVYGYVQTRFGTINIDRLGARSGDESVAGVRVIFTATHPKKRERLVVGYYLNATVFRRRQAGVRHLPSKKEQVIEHSIQVEAENAILIQTKNRTLKVPHHDGKGLPGQTIVFYPADSKRVEATRFLSDFNNFVGTTPTLRAKPSLRSSNNPGGWPASPDIEQNRRVEQAAINTVRSHFGNNGIDRQKDNCGWDLEFITSECRYCIEVKGNSGEQPQAELSVHEYKTIRRVIEGKFDEGEYRLAIVTAALTSPKLHLFTYEGPERWRCELTDREISAQERTAARFS